MSLKPESKNERIRGIRGGIAALLAAACITGCGVQTKTPEKAPAAADNHFITTACGMNMASIPAGEFSMGADDGPVDVKPAHRVKVDGFLMDQNEITQEVYEKVTGKTP